MKAVIMAGGEGTRLRPLSCDLPKPMVPLLNRPLLEHILLLLRRHGVREVALTLCYRPHLIEEYFGDGARWGMKLRYFREEVPLGTAGSVRQAAEFLGEETFLVLSGDALTDFDLTAALRFHQQAGGVATLVLTRVQQPLEYGIVITDESGRIVRFLEKPGWSEVFSDTVNTGIYVLEPQVLSAVPADRPYDFSKDLFPRLLASGAPLMGWVAEGYWSDIGNLEEYRRGHEDALEGRVHLETPWVLRRVQGETEVWQEEGARVDPGAKLVGPVYLGRGTVVEAGAEVG
ncbi:MAG: NDP-sugar synthase, partial [Bacillota bacterium]|nr:NDP-sugar synthase [Bacillota bacterium]